MKIASLLLATLVASTLGLLLLAQWRLHAVQQRMRSPQAHETTRSWSMGRAEYEAARVGQHEVRLGESMYDLRSVRIAGDSVHLVAVEDHDENELLHHLREAFGIRRGQPESADQAGAWLLRLLALQYVPTDLPEWGWCYRISPFRAVFFEKMPVLSAAPAIVSPPPEDFGSDEL
jgi:hypothetical protein